MRGCNAPQDQCVSVREQRWRRIAAQALKEAPAGVRAVGVSSWDVDDYGRPFGGDEDRFEEVDQGNA
jgi:endonuclease YncB( thermonuclease family)